MIIYDNIYVLIIDNYLLDFGQWQDSVKLYII